jgi:mannose-6-phosphate isomerase class I
MCCNGISNVPTDNLRLKKNSLIHNVIINSLSKVTKICFDLAELFSGLMTQKQTIVDEKLTTLIERIKKIDHKSPEENLILKLFDQFGKDIGLFCVFFLNYLTLRPYESTFLGANEPHAYISGISSHIYV